MTLSKPRTTRQTRFHARYGPWAVVTGASEGIGRAIAHRLAGMGFDLVLVARRESTLAALASELEQHQVATRVIVSDLGTPEGVAAVESATRDLDVGLLVACAGFGTSGELIASTLEHELAMVDVNCRAVVAMSHVFGRRFVARGRGGLVLMSSLVAFQGVPRAANYAATKAYVQSLAEGLRLELGPRGVDVLASAPGPVHSGFGARADMKMGMGLAPDLVADRTLAALGRTTTVRPGWLSWFLGYSLASVPRFVRTRILAAVMRGFTQHQRG
ncbi:SDR family NAD(P)-dependent oxidoreductase [Nannocystaceae bacterium ST9]